MGKYLQQIEIAPSKLFDKEKERQFIDETREIVDKANSQFKRNVKSNFGKVAVRLWPVGVIEQHSLPRFEYDTISNVCMVNVTYDIDEYISEADLKDRMSIVYSLLKDAFSSLPKEVGLDGGVVLKIIDELKK